MTSRKTGIISFSNTHMMLVFRELMTQSEFPLKKLRLEQQIRGNLDAKLRAMFGSLLLLLSLTSGVILSVTLIPAPRSVTHFVYYVSLVRSRSRCSSRSYSLDYTTRPRALSVSRQDPSKCSSVQFFTCPSAFSEDLRLAVLHTYCNTISVVQDCRPGVFADGT